MRQSKIDVRQLVDWIILNRSGHAFKGYPLNKIVNTIRLAKIDEMFAYYVDSGNITGVCCGQKVNENTYMVHDILVTKKGVLKDFVAYFLQLHPGCQLIGKVGNRDRQFVDPHKLWRRLTK